MRKSIYPKKVNSFGACSLKSRLDNKLTLVQVANLVGISDAYVLQIENNKKMPSKIVAKRLAKVLKTKKLLKYYKCSKCGGKI